MIDFVSSLLHFLVHVIVLLLWTCKSASKLVILSTIHSKFLLTVNFHSSYFHIHYEVFFLYPYGFVEMAGLMVYQVSLPVKLSFAYSVQEVLATFATLPLSVRQPPRTGRKTVQEHSL